jgi:ankyrin repeat protein
MDQMNSTPIHPDYDGTSVEAYGYIASPLMAAASSNDTLALYTCILAGCDVDVKNRDGMTALHLAAMLDSTESVKMLIDSGCHIQTNIAGNLPPPHFYAEAEGYHTASAMLLAAMTRGKIKKNRLKKYTPQPFIATCSVSLHACAFHGELAAIRALIKTGYYDINYADSDGFTVLTMAAIQGHVDVAKFLISIGCNKDGVDVLGRTPAVHACMNGRNDMLKFLITSGCDLDKADKRSLTPTDHLARYKARLYGVTPEEVMSDVREMIPQVREVIEEFLSKEKKDKAEKKKEKNNKKNMKKKEKKKEATRQEEAIRQNETDSQNEARNAYDIDSDDEEIDKCDCAECLALNAKMDAEALGV